MEPAAVLAVVVKARGIAPTNAQLGTVHSNLVKAEAAGAAFGSGMQKSASRAAAAGSAMSSAGRSINRNVGLPLAAMGALSAKAAIDFEDSFADIRKTVDATEKQYARLETGVRGLAKEIPISVNELNKLGGEAGALGVRRKDLLGFIKTAAELGTTTDLSSEEAAVSLARLSNIMKTPAKAFRNLASTFVDLGNKGASTEQEIAMMSLRIAGSGETLGLAEHEVLGLAAALANVGIRAEMGGTAVSRVMLQMQEAIAKGGGELKMFAKISGMSSAEFEKSFKKSVPETIAIFSRGVGKLNKEGKPIISTLKEVELGERRVGDTILRIAGNTKQFTQAQNVANAEWRDNNALTAEANKRYGTTASQVKLAMNEIRDLGITMGQNLLPVIADVLGVMGDVVGVFAALPDGAQETILKVGAVIVIFGILLSLAGKLVSGYAAVARGVVWLTTAQAANTATTNAAAAANARLAGSLHAAAAAQTELLIANKSGAVTGSIPVGPPIANTTVGGAAAGKTGAARLAGGLARALPFALAAVGIGNIVSSAVQGDMEGAGFKAGGALVGGIAGALLGKSPAAAALGSALGSFVGGAIGDLFGDGGEDVRRWADQVARSTDKVKASVSGSKTAFNTAAGAQRQLSKIGRRQERVSKAVERAESRLSSLRKSDKAGAPAVRRAEEQLARLKNKEIRLTRRQWSQEQLLGGARNRGKQHLRNLRESEVGLIRAKQLGVESSQRQLRKARQVLEVHTREGKSLKILTEDEERLRRKRQKARAAVQSRTEWEKRLAGTMREIANKFGPKYADHLRQTIPLWTRTKEQIRSSERFMRRLTPAITPITVQMRKFGDSGKGSTRDVKRGFEKVKGALGPFRSESSTQLNRAKGDMRSWRKASVTGVDTVANKLGLFAGQLGIKNVAFGVAKKGKNANRQTGGMVVPGSGTGDKVPLTAMVEPGEVVHVLNMRASKDRTKLSALERANLETPRFPHRESRKLQTGGLMGGFNVDGALPGFVPFMNFLNSMYGPIYVMSGMRPGSITTSGNVSNHASGHAVDISTTQGGLNMASSAATLNASGAAAKRMDALHGYMGANIKLPGDFLWRTDTGGNHWNHIHRGITSAHAANPALMAAYLSKLPKGEAFGGIGSFAFQGPDGVLKEVGQAVLDKASKMADQWLAHHLSTAQFGTGPMAPGGLHGLDGPGRIVGASTYHPDAVTGTVGAAGKSLIGRMAFAELGMGNNLGGLPFGAKLKISRAGQSVVGEKLDIGAGGGDVQGHRRDIDLWHETANAIGLPDDWLGLVKVHGLQRGGAMQAMAQAMQKGGKAPKGKGAPISSQIAGALKGISGGKNLPRYRADLRKATRRIEGIGLGQRRIDRLGQITKEVERFAEYAGNASTLTTQDEEGNISHGTFKGRDEGAWLNEQLGSLMSLRREVLSAQGVIAKHHVPRVNKLLTNAKKRLIHVRRMIRKAEKQKLAIERRVKEIERAQDRSKRGVESEIKELERQLDRARGAKKPNRQAINSIRAQIKDRKTTLSNSDRDSTKQIRKLNRKVRGINKAQGNRRRVESSLHGTIIPSLEGKRKGLHETGASLLSDGGEARGVNFMGLQQIQGAGGPLGEVANPPELGSLGGEIFGVQARMKQIAEESKKAKLDPKDESSVENTAEELLAIEKEINLSLKKENLALKYQTGVFQNFPSVQDVAVPKGVAMAAFAKGGVVRSTSHVAAWVGERGPEPVFAPEGARVIPSHEARAALSGGGVTHLVIDELIVYPDGVEISAGGDTFEADVKKVTRKQSRSSSRRTPGGKNMRGRRP